jgi:membrane-bound ClpP family serine protease
MTLIIGLIVTAFVLFFFEIFLPGGVLAVIGGMFLLLASILAYQELGLLWALGIFFSGMIGALVLFFLEIRFISKTSFGRQLSLQSSISARLNPVQGENPEGAEGVTLTVMAPTGKVEVKGTPYTAVAEDGFLEKGVPIRVIRSETFKIIVTRK